MVYPLTQARPAPAPIGSVNSAASSMVGMEAMMNRLAPERKIAL
jgi:hypothetical protein